MIRQGRIERLAYAIDLVRDEMEQSDTRHGRESGAYFLLLEAADKLLKAKSIVMGIDEVGRSSVAT